MIIKKELNVVDYVVLVNSMVAGYFDEDGKYSPHYARLNNIRLFYNFCVSDCDLELPETIENIEDIEILLDNAEFMEAYTNRDFTSEGLTFDNAYMDADNIVSDKLSSINRVIEGLEKIVNKFADIMEDTVSDETLSKLMKIADGVNSGDISADSIVKAYKENMLSGA